jgi:hypothetical protein
MSEDIRTKDQRKTRNEIAVEVVRDLVTQLHKAKHSGHPKSCPEPICRDAWRTITELGG